MIGASAIARVGCFGCPASARLRAIRYNLWVLHHLPIEEWTRALRPAPTVAGHGRETSPTRGSDVSLTGTGRQYCTLCKVVVQGSRRAHERQEHGGRAVCRTIAGPVDPTETSTGGGSLGPRP